MEAANVSQIILSEIHVGFRELTFLAGEQIRMEAPGKNPW
jgi:hypothetical protein